MTLQHITHIAGRIILLLGLFLPSAGAQTPDTLSRHQWEELTRRLDYGEAREQTTEPIAPEPPSSPRDWNGAGALRVVLFILAGAALAVVLAMLLGVGTPQDKKLNGDRIDITDIEEDLPGAELDDFLTQALQQQDYHLAVRLHYLQLLQTLSERQVIRWKKDKTNREYLLETAAHTWHTEFGMLTTLFERIRYGRLLLDAESYARIRPRFEQLQQRIADSKTTVI